MTRKVAIVTGGSLGLGREVARGLLAQGYRVAIFGRGQAALDEAVADLNGDVLAVRVDVGDEASVAAGFANVDAALGPVGTLVNNAAVFQPFEIADATAERVMPLVQVNFCGAVYCMREAVARMRTLGGGDIINVSSESVRQSTPLYSVYTSTKAALEQMTKLMGEELREDGIRCTTFRVGKMHTHGATNPDMGNVDVEKFVRLWQSTGAQYWTGQGMQPATAAAALVNLLLTPRDGRVELIELRSC